MRGVVVCAHAFGLGVWLGDLAQFGRVNVTHMDVPETQTLDDCPAVRAPLTARVLGYSGAHRQLRLGFVKQGM